MSECESCGYRIPPEATHCPACANPAPRREPVSAPVLRSTGPGPVPPKKASPLPALIVFAVIVAITAGAFVFISSESRKQEREFEEQRREMQQQFDRAFQCEICSGSGTMLVSDTPDGPKRREKCPACGGTGRKK